MPIVIVAAMASAAALASWAGVRINWTPSEPVGVYQVQPASVGIDRGDLIEFCYAGEPNKYIAHGVCPNGSAPFFKETVGVPGDLVVVGDAGVMINGVMLPDSRPLRYSVADPSMALPVLRGRFVLSKDEYWSYGSGMPSRSYDSRYFGAVKLADIRSVSKH